MKQLLLLFAFLLAPHMLAAKPLVTDISSHDITIHTAFEGTELMLFGARNDPGDIIVVVRGPERHATIRRKERVFGIWINRVTETISPVPAFYALASSRDFDQITKSIYFDALGIEPLSAVTPFAPGQELAGPQRRVFSRALMRKMRQERLYGSAAGEVEFIGQTLFKTVIPFPDNMPRGDYTAETYLFSDGELAGVHTTPIHVYKSGLDAFLYDMATRYAYLYGIAAILIAAGAGWLANTIFRRL